MTLTDHHSLGSMYGGEGLVGVICIDLSIPPCHNEKNTHPSHCIATPLPTTLTLPSIQDSPCTILSVDHSPLHDLTAHHCRPEPRQPLHLPSSSLLMPEKSALAGGNFRQCNPSRGIPSLSCTFHHTLGTRRLVVSQAKCPLSFPYPEIARA